MTSRGGSPAPGTVGLATPRSAGDIQRGGGSVTTTTEQGPGASDLGKIVIKTRKVTHWQPNFSLSGAGEPGTYIFQLILDHGASEVVLTVNVDDADNLFDWLTASSDVYYDLEREVLLFGARSVGA
jgi:hypothetical protein